MGTLLAVREPPVSDAAPDLSAVVAVSSNKGGVGKTTLATNLAIYLRALREDQPVAVVGLDDQGTLDRMFEIDPPGPAAGNLKHGWASTACTTCRRRPRWACSRPAPRTRARWPASSSAPSGAASSSSTPRATWRG